MTEPPKADLEAVEGFLSRYAPAGPWVLTAIRVDKKGIETVTFGPTSGVYLTSWLASHGDCNIYFHVNTTMRPLTKKAAREDIKSVDWLHIDIDPRAGEDLDAERKRALALLTTDLPEGVPPPTVIIFSGGGYQAFWKLENSIKIDGDLPKAEDAKRWNQWLETAFGADNCHNIDRIMRLPGTINIPDAGKIKKGRTPALAKLVSFDADRVYPLSAFKQADVQSEAPAPAPKKAKAKGKAAATIELPVAFDAETLKSRGLSDFARIVIAQGDDPDNPDRWKGNRSNAVWFVCCAMVRAGFNDAEIVGVLLDKDWAISEHVLEQKNSLKYAWKQARDARADVETEFDTDKKGVPYKSQRNIRVGLRKLGVELRYNEFAGKYMIKGLEGHGPVLQDDAVMTLRLAMDEKFEFLPGKEFFMDVVRVHALQSRYDPVLDYLDGLTWDDTPRIDRWLITYAEAEDSKYTRAVGPLMLIAAVRRARNP